MPLDLLADLDSDQRVAVLAVRGPVLIRAVAGAGKTRAVTHRIAHAVATGAQSAGTGLALTYTTKAAAELRHRLLQLQVPEVAAATIHSAAWRQLRHFWPRALGGEPWRVVSSRTALIAAAAAQADLSPAELRAVQVEIDWGKAQGLDAAAYLTHERSISVGQATVAEIWGRYQDLCHQQRSVDFDDVLMLTAGMLSSRPDIAEEVRARYQWFTIDEYQDITPLQQTLLEQWLGESREICVVGDPDQSIFEFAGANPDFLRKFPTQYPDAQVVQLQRTYRCPAPVVAWANSVLRQLPASLPLTTRLSAGAAEARLFRTESEELAGIAGEVKEWLAAGFDPREVAILVRTGNQADRIQSALDAAGVPAISRGQAGFSSSARARLALLALKAESYGEPGEALIEVVHRLAAEQGWQPNPMNSTLSRMEWSALSALVEMARDLSAARPDASIDDLLDEVAHRTQSADEPRPAAVTVSTIHLAKGLQWQRVWLPDLVEGRMPLTGNQSDPESETRLLHVAITRAGDMLRVSRAATDDTGRELPASRFWQWLAAAEVPTETLPSAPDGEGAATPQAAPRCQVCGTGLEKPLELATGRCPAHPGTPRPALSSALVAWRSEVAKTTGSPEWQVLTDTAIAALVEHLPSNLDELGQLHGMTAAKVADYGADLLEIVARHAD